MSVRLLISCYTDPAPTEVYTLSLHDALPIFRGRQRAPVDLAAGGERQLGEWHDHVGHHRRGQRPGERGAQRARIGAGTRGGDRKSTRLNSSHSQISYAVFCLKKKKNILTSA